MKAFLFYPAVLLVCLVACKGKSAQKEADFYVRGNCGMCEERIETTLRNVNGVESVDYNVDTKFVHVKFDTLKVKEIALHKAVAATGHETKLEPMDTKAHDELPECCKKGSSH